MANQQKYQVKGFMRGDESGEIYTNEWEGIDGYEQAERWLNEMGKSFELFSEGWVNK